MKQDLIYAFEIMGKGMASIFVVIILLTFIVMFMAKISEVRNNNGGQDED
ncbi:MAG TPA: OadG-related small transporter subunit [Mobilitalea sp.]|nr:OadG-related small transporter subunit [Mobilitalea sp.]